MVKRKPFQGVLNVIKFNPRFYLLALALMLVLGFIIRYSSDDAVLHWLASLLLALVLIPTMVSLVVTYYVYDRSELYTLPWIHPSTNTIRIAQIHAGFDECSAQLKAAFPKAQVFEFDFFDDTKQTEPSIKIARTMYPPSPDTKTISFDCIPLEDDSADLIHLMFAAHEIRTDKERVLFLKECKRILRSEGTIYIIEHWRDTYNFLAYTIGFLHFHSNATWKNNFKESDLTVVKTENITPFVHCYTLMK